MRLLLENGADIEALDYHNETALFGAAQTGKKLLISFKFRCFNPKLAKIYFHHHFCRVYS